MADIFISYRRSDAGGHAGRLFDHLCARLDRAHLFFDVESLAAGQQWRDSLRAHLGASRVVLVVIGPDWFEAQDGGHHRRLDQPDDVVRAEIVEADRLGKVMLPVLVGGAQVPLADALPADWPDALKNLGSHQAFRIDHDEFDTDVTKLETRLRELLPDLPWRAAAGDSHVPSFASLARALVWPLAAALVLTWATMRLFASYGMAFTPETGAAQDIKAWFVVWLIPCYLVAGLLRRRKVRRGGITGEVGMRRWPRLAATGLAILAAPTPQAALRAVGPAWALQQPRVERAAPRRPAPVLSQPAVLDVLVQGRVVDRAGQPIEDVLVTQGTAGENRPTVTTNARGTFELAVSPASDGWIELRFRSPRDPGSIRSIRLHTDSEGQVVNFRDLRIEVRLANWPSEPTSGAPPPPPPTAIPPPPSPPKGQGAPPPVPPSVTYSYMRRSTGWSTLVSTSAEERGFGLYSYLLFRRRAAPGDSAFELQLSTLTALLGEVETRDELLRYAPAAAVNITYVPVRRPLDLPGAATLLENYDFARAGVLLSAVPERDGDGPFFVSVATPLLSGGASPDRMLVQDLSNVPPRLASLWVHRFVQQVSEPRDWDCPGFEQFLLTLRTEVAREADAFPEYREALVGLIVLK